MTAAETHAHPCTVIGMDAARSYGSLGVGALLGLIANIGDHAPDDAARDAIRMAFEEAALELPALIAAATGGTAGGDRS